MPLVSPKRQVTLPKSLCDRLGVVPGDEVDILEYNGRITILKRTKGRAAGLLKHVKPDPHVSDEESLHDSLARRRARAHEKVAE